MRCMLTDTALLVALFIAPTWSNGTLRAAEKATPSDRNMPSYREIVKQVLPAVVNIESQAAPHAMTKRQSYEPAEPTRDFNLPEEFRRFFDMPGKHGSPFPDSSAQPRLGSGTGFIIDPSGVIVTAYHVVRGADHVKVKLQDGRRFISKSIKSDPKTDLAIVRIETKETLPFLKWGDSNAMEIGDRVLAVGAPYGLEGTVTQGIVSGKGRSLRLNMYEDFIQTDAAINPGNSGGPLVNMDGNVIGVNSVIKSMSGGFQGVGLAVSSDLARQVVDQLLKNGAVQRGFMGVQVSMLTPEVAQRLGLKDQQGLLVAKVFDKSPAAKAGMKDGDVITALDGKPMTTPSVLASSVARLAVGKMADLVIWRDGKTQKLQVNIEQQPEQFGLNQETEKPAQALEKNQVWLNNIGVAVTDLTKELSERWGFSGGMEGALVADVQENSPAALAGVRAGDLIQKVDGKPVSSAKMAEAAVVAGSLQKGILLQIRSEDRGVSLVMLRNAND